MNDIHVYSIQTYENQILHNYYCQIMAHEVCDASFVAFASLFIDISPNFITLVPLLLILLLLFIYLLVFFFVTFSSFAPYFFSWFCCSYFFTFWCFFLFYLVFQICTTLLLLCVGMGKLKVFSNSNSNF